MHFMKKNILLQEVNHRVKNNLSIVASLMNLQSEKSHDEYHKQLFMECRNRLESISSVHELVYKTKSYSLTPVSGFNSAYSDLKTIFTSPYNYADIRIFGIYIWTLLVLLTEIVDNGIFANQ